MRDGVFAFSTFGDLLKYLRRRAQLTQRELAIAVGYTEGHLSRLEKNERPPDLATVAALFVPALDLEKDPETAAQLIRLAATAHGEQLQAGESLTISRVQKTTEISESAESVPSNLPIQLTTFIGRQTEIAEITALLSRETAARLITLTGPGGIGKTRLALQTSIGLAHLYPDGIWFVDLTPLSTPKLIPQTVASALGLMETRGQPVEKPLITYLRSKKTLILIDNCEHLIHETAQFVEKILHTCADVQILATSRELLNVPGEVNFRVPSLSLPESEDHASQMLAGHEALQLFIERARNVQPSLKDIDLNSAIIVRICRKLEGIPLAIELAAARMNFMSLSQIEAHLNDRFHLLTSGQTTLPRHQSLRATLEWSHDLLSEDEKVLFRRLSMFAGGWTLEAANLVCANPGNDTVDLQSQLVNKSLVVVERQPDAEVRFRILETIREYAREKLHEAGEVTYIREKHFDFFHILAQQMEPKMFGPEKAIWLDRAAADIDNFRAALIWSLEPNPTGALPPLANRAERGIQLVVSLLDFYWCRGYMVEAREWLERLLAVDMPPSRVRAWGFQKAGWLNRASGDIEKARMLLDHALSMSREVGDKYRAGMSLVDLGEAARDHQGDLTRAIEYHSEALSLFQEVGNNQGIGVTSYCLAQTHMQKGDLEIAGQLWQKGLDLSHREGDKSHAAWGLQGLGDVALLKGELAEAMSLHRKGLTYLSEIMDQPRMVLSFEALAQIAAAQGQPQRAAILWGAAEKLLKVLNMPVVEPAGQSFYTSLIPTVRDQLGDEAFEAAWAKGRGLTLAQAIEYALALSDK